MRICYYDLLSIERTATADEIKKAYRRQALIWHPDKNGDRVQEATERFAMIQEAYEVLSDPHERSWYDGHRDAILRGNDRAGTKESSAGTASEDLMAYFSVSNFNGFGDDDKGFYAVYRRLFQKLNEEEEKAYDPEDEDAHSYVRYPEFGNSTTPFADQDGYLGYGAYARDFYAAWMNFSTVKSFQWMDKWRLSEAPSRYVRRAMEKENKKAREQARKEYNETIRSLAAFVRKRDPRFKSYIAEEQRRREALAAEQKERALREKEEMVAQAAAYKEQEWAKVTMVISEDEEDEQDEQGSGDPNAEGDLYCVVCDRYYKSEQQYAAHENSKRHIKLAQIMKEEMMAEEEAFDFSRTSPTETSPVAEEDADPVDVISAKKKKKNKNKSRTPRFGFEEMENEEEVDDGISALTAALELEQQSRRRGKNSTPATTVPAEGDEAAEREPKESAKAKREKRKEKKKQKEEKQAAVSILLWPWRDGDRRC
ncbi:hypothetical protein BX666DRAFT_1908347 [Dichotomocladium elegans]|nr:hypothetical protein BX666DRAFT_1908347 [Dichotomocladium elegans]